MVSCAVCLVLSTQDHAAHTNATERAPALAAADEADEAAGPLRVEEQPALEQPLGAGVTGASQHEDPTSFPLAAGAAPAAAEPEASRPPDEPGASEVTDAASQQTPQTGETAPADSVSSDPSVAGAEASTPAETPPAEPAAATPVNDTDATDPNHESVATESGAPEDGGPANATAEAGEVEAAVHVPDESPGAAETAPDPRLELPVAPNEAAAAATADPGAADGATAGEDAPGGTAAEGQADGDAAPAQEEATQAAPEDGPAAEREGAAEGEAAAEGEPEAGVEILPLEKWKEQALQRIQSDAMMAGLRGDAAAEATGQPPAAGAEPTLSEGGTEAAAALPAIGTFVRPTTPLKDRFNYLSSTVGAKVLAASPEMQNERNILNEDKDKYMMT